MERSSDTQSIDVRRMLDGAGEASRLLKALANPSRLLILCHLAEGERTVGELERLVELRQPSLSQQLARLRADGLVSTRRNGKAIHYSLASGEARAVLVLLYDLFCNEANGRRASPPEHAAPPEQSDRVAI